MFNCCQQRIYYTATYFDRTYRCGKEEELLRLVTTKMYPHAMEKALDHTASIGDRQI